MSAFSTDLAAYLSPAGWWRLGDASGTVAVDVEGTHNGNYSPFGGGGVTLGQPGLVAGDSTTSAQFNGTSGALTCPFTGFSASNGTLTILFKWTAGTALLSDNTGSGARWLAFDSSGTFSVRLGSSTTVNTSKATTAVRDGNKHMLAITWASSAFTVYLDGTSIATGTTGATAAATPWFIAENGNITTQRSVVTAQDVAWGTTAINGTQAAQLWTDANSSAYTQTVSGAVTFTGATSNATSRAQAASLTFTGAHGKSIGVAVAGSLSFTGALGARAVARALAASVQFAGAGLKATSRAQVSALTFTGATRKTVARGVAGAVTFTGATRNATARAYAAAVSFTGSAQKATGRAVAGAVSFAGSVASRSGHALALAASLTFTGGITRAITHTLSGVLSFNGNLAGPPVTQTTGSDGGGPLRHLAAHDFTDLEELDDEEALLLLIA